MVWVRSALFNAWFIGVTVVIGLAGVFARRVAPERALGLAQRWARLVLAGARVLCGIRVTLTGLERIPSGAALIASQHQSAFDTLIWAALLPRVAYIYKRELERIPLFGPMLQAAGQIPVDRTASPASVRALLAAANQAKRDGRQIVIFPEGTRMRAGVAGRVRGGFALISQRTGLPVIPVATDSGHLWGRRAFLKRPGCIRVAIGDPISPDVPAHALVAALEAHWQQAERARGAVDISVDSASNSLTSPQVRMSPAAPNGSMHP